MTRLRAAEYSAGMSSVIVNNPERTAEPLAAGEISAVVEQELQAAQFIDVHTHLYQPSLGENGLWGIDNLITYHYLEAELFRSSRITPAQYFALSTRAKADAIWRALFVENAPVSEATRGVVAVLKSFGLPSIRRISRTPASSSDARRSTRISAASSSWRASARR